VLAPFDSTCAMKAGHASSSSGTANRGCLCLCLEVRWPRLWSRRKVARSHAELAAYNAATVSSSSSGLLARVALKRTLAKACILKLAQDGVRRKEGGRIRKVRMEAVTHGKVKSSAAFPSPKPQRPVGGCTSRQLVPAMVLPRWESFDIFKSGGLPVGKLSTVQVVSGANGTEPRRLACMVCQKAVGGGDAILALVCAHVFCPSCFEVFLRRRWADLASNLVDSSETEHIPCPLCSAVLQRQDVHTLTEPEVLELAGRVELVHQLAEAIAIAPDRREGATMQNPNATLAAVTAAAKAAAAAVSQTKPLVRRMSTNEKTRSASPSPSRPLVPVLVSTVSHDSAVGQTVASNLTIAKGVVSEVKDVASSTPVSANDVTQRLAAATQLSTPQLSSSSTLPNPALSPASGYRTYNVHQSFNARQGTPPKPHRSVSMPIQPNASLMHATAPKLPAAGGGSTTIPPKQTLSTPPVALTNPGTIRRTLNNRKGFADSLPGTAGSLHAARPLQTVKAASYVSASQVAVTSPASLG